MASVPDEPRENESAPQQAAAIPWRRSGGMSVEVCLIRRRHKPNWGIPKGYIERQSWREAALNEAYEEAGLRGQLIGDSIGTYLHKKGVVILTVVVFAMEVLEELPDWPEMRWRERRWCSLEEASERLAKHPARRLLDGIGKF